MGMRIGRPELTEEGEVPQPEHVEGGEQRGHQADEPQDRSRSRRKKGLVENCVLAEETGEGRDAGDGEDPGAHGPEGDGHCFTQAPHGAHILLPAHGMDDRAGSQKEQALEEGMRDQVEDGRGVSGGSAGQEHIAELGDGGVGQHAFDVRLHHADGGREQGRGGADDCDHAQGERRAVKEHVRAHDHVDAGGHHGGGMDQGGDRCGAFHRVRQPDVKRNLRRLAGSAEHQQQRNGGEEAALHLRVLR